jgi:hypothetical protein
MTSSLYFQTTFTSDVNANESLMSKRVPTCNKKIVEKNSQNSKMLGLRGREMRKRNKEYKVLGSLRSAPKLLKWIFFCLKELFCCRCFFSGSITATICNIGETWQILAFYDRSGTPICT